MEGWERDRHRAEGPGTTFRHSRTRAWRSLHEPGSDLSRPIHCRRTRCRSRRSLAPRKALMDQMTPPQEPQSAAQFDDRKTAAVNSVLIEIGQILGSFKEKFAIIGGAVPWLLLANEDMPHVGTLDVDVGLDAEALGDGEYATLISALQGHGYAEGEGLGGFQLVRQVPARDGGEAIDVVVDFLMPRDAEIVKNDSPLINDFAVQRADGVDLAMWVYQLVAVAGPMPDCGTKRVGMEGCVYVAMYLCWGAWRWEGIKRRRMPTTSTTAYGTTPMGSRRWHRNAANCWAMPAASAASGTSPTSSTPSMGTAPLA